MIHVGDKIDRVNPPVVLNNYTPNYNSLALPHADPQDPMSQNDAPTNKTQQWYTANQRDKIQCHVTVSIYTLTLIDNIFFYKKKISLI